MNEKSELHIITALSRVGNLPALLAAVSPAAESFDLMWHIVHDCGSAPCRFGYERRSWLRLSHAYVKKSIVGNAQKNKALDAIKSGLVWVLDDDNLPAVGFFEELAKLDDAHPDADVFLFAQLRAGEVVQPKPEIGSIDAAQMVARRKAIGSLRFPLDVYASDGHVITRLCAKAGTRVVSVDRPLTLYNALRPQ